MELARPTLLLAAFATVACTSAASNGGNGTGALSAHDETAFVTRDGVPVPIAALAAGVEQPRVCDSTPLGLGEECQASTEEEITQQILGNVFKFQSVQNPPSEKLSKRDFHPKATACVAARFTVTAATPELRQGLFAEAKSYPAVIRFSNGAPASVGAGGAIALHGDADPDARAMAIKVTGVPGDGLLTGVGFDGEPRTQDFLMANYPVFFISNINQAVLFFRSLVTPGAHPGEGLLPAELKALAGGQTKIDNVFGERYWSQSSYRFGIGADANGHKRAAKFSTLPIACDSPSAPVSFAQPPAVDVVHPTDAQRADASFLRATAAAQLAKGDACFVFGVQLQTDPTTMPVEDPNVKWDEMASPFVEVARIRVPSAQDVNDPARQAFCENQAFSPWNGTPDAKPLGFINRLRLTAYSGISAKRRLENKVKLGFPSGTESFFDVVKNMR